MSNELEVEIAHLRAMAAQLRTARGDIHSKLREVRDVADGLVDQWQGAAATGFQQVMQRWDTDQRKLLEALDGTADLLERSAGKYEAAEGDHRRMFGRLGATGRIDAGLNPPQLPPGT